MMPMTGWIIGDDVPIMAGQWTSDQTLRFTA